jgi:hypothetical protein
MTTDKIKTQYPELLNALSEMQESPAYAVRRSVLAEAERVIVKLEKEAHDLIARFDKCIAIKDAARDALEKEVEVLKAKRGIGE